MKKSENFDFFIDFCFLFYFSTMRGMVTIRAFIPYGDDV